MCLDLSLSCDVSPTAFCVGAIVVLPLPFQSSLSPSPSSTSSPQASFNSIVLSTGYSREAPDPSCHAESSAISKLVHLPPGHLSALIRFHAPDHPLVDAPLEDVLLVCDVYTTLEPCSVRTSGKPDCATLLARHRVRRVFVVSLSCALLSFDL